MGHFSLVSNWRPHLGAISWFLKSLLTVSFLDLNWPEAAPHDTGKCEWSEFSLRYKGIIQVSKYGSLPRLVLKTVTPAEMKTQDTNAGFCHWQVRSAEQLEERNVSVFCSPLEGFACLFCLLLRTGPFTGAGDSGQPFGWFSHSWRAPTTDVWCSHQRRSSIQSQRCTVTRRGRRSS